MNLEDYKDLLPVYVAGKLSGTEKLELERAIDRETELQGELKILVGMSRGLEILDSISRDHVDSELLARYAVEPGAVSKGERDQIESHLTACDECREEYELCDPTPAVRKQPAEPKSNALKQFFEWLLFGQARLRPVYAALVVLLLAVPVIYLGVQQPLNDAVAAYDIVPFGARTLAASNRIEIGPDDRTVRLQFVVPVLPDRLYTIELQAADDSPILIWPDNRASKAFTVDIPTTYLDDRTYTLVVKETEGGTVQEVFTFPLEIAVTDH